MVLPKRSARRRSNRRLDNWFWGPLKWCDCGFLLIIFKSVKATVRTVWKQYLGMTGRKGRASCISTTHVYTISTFVVSITLRVDIRIFRIIWIFFRMADDIKGKVAAFDALYTELLTQQQNACVMGAPDRHTVLICCLFAYILPFLLIL